MGGAFAPQTDVKPNLTQNNIDPLSQGQAAQGDKNGPGSLGMSSSITSAQPRLERLLRETNPSTSPSPAGVTSASGFYSSSNVGNQQQQRPMYLTNSNQSKSQHPSSLQEILQSSGPSTVASTASNMVGSFVALSSANTATSNVLTSPPPFVGETKSGNLPSVGYPAPPSNNSIIKKEVYVRFLVIWMSRVGHSSFFQMSADPTSSVKSENPGSNKGGFTSGGKSWSPTRNKVSVKSEPKVAYNITVGGI